jgi:hypothetical protein
MEMHDINLSILDKNVPNTQNIMKFVVHFTKLSVSLTI